jgi:hypothetical protein
VMLWKNGFIVEEEEEEADGSSILSVHRNETLTRVY